jgi:hypothetical protein
VWGGRGRGNEPAGGTGSSWAAAGRLLGFGAERCSAELSSPVCFCSGHLAPVQHSRLLQAVALVDLAGVRQVPVLGAWRTSGGDVIGGEGEGHGMGRGEGHTGRERDIRVERESCWGAVVVGGGLWGPIGRSSGAVGQVDGRWVQRTEHRPAALIGRVGRCPRGGRAGAPSYVMVGMGMGLDIEAEEMGPASSKEQSSSSSSSSLWWVAARSWQASPSWGSADEHGASSEDVEELRIIMRAERRDLSDRFFGAAPLWSAAAAAAAVSSTPSVSFKRHC